MGSQRDYYEYMGYPSEELTRRYATYSERFAAGARVLDVGCGRGEFLRLLADRGVEAIGIDLDSEMIDEVRRMGLQGEVSDAVTYLKAHPASLDGVFAAHLIEHLPPDQMRALVRGAVGALKPGGRLLLVTPNPHSLEVHLYEFWTDLQHVRFYTPEIMRWVLHESGLSDVETGENPLYRSARDLEPTVTRPAQIPAAQTHYRLRARLRERLAEWLQPASSLDRIQNLELKSSAHETSIENLAEHFSALYPPGEFYVTGVR